MSFSFEEKLQRIRELSDRRIPIRDELNEIDAELARLIGEVPSDEPATSPRIDATYTPRIDRLKDPAKVNQIGRGNGAKNYVPKSCCGSKGPRHLKTCGGEVRDTVTPPIQKVPKTDERGAFTENTYADIRKAMDSRDFSSIDFAHDNRVNLREINYAIRSDSFSDYLKRRTA